MITVILHDDGTWTSDPDVSDTLLPGDGNDIERALSIIAAVVTSQTQQAESLAAEEDDTQPTG